jgi:hypothetical protein
VILYGCEAWSLTLREEHRLRVLENRALKTIFGPKRKGVVGGWRMLHIEGLHILHSSSSIIRMTKSRRMRWAGHKCGRRGTHKGYSWERKKETTRKTKMQVSG